VYREVINLLINYRAEVGLVDKLSQILLHYSTHLGYGVVTKLLVNRGLVIMIEDNNRYTARDLAKGSDRVIKALTK
jgi:hypothetical protein